MDQKLVGLLIRHEGLRLAVYLDTEGHRTIGVGHNLDAKPLPFDVSHGITKEQALGILAKDVDDTLAFLHAYCNWFAGLDLVRGRAIIDMAFNLMHKLLGFSKMIADIKNQDWEGASHELLNSNFALQTGNRAKELAQMLRTGQDI